MKKIIISLLGLIALFVSCEQDKDDLMTTLEVVNEEIVSTYDSISLQCQFVTTGTIRNAYAEYSTKKDFKNSNRVELYENAGIYSGSINNLLDNTNYYIRYVVSNMYSSLTSLSVTEVRTKMAALPTVATTDATNIDVTTATLGGNVKADNGKAVTERGVVYSTSEYPTISNNKKTSGSGLGEFSVDLSDLLLGTTYYVRAYAKNSKGIGYGQQVSFRTKSSIPTVTTTVTDVAATSAIINGNVTHSGGESVIERGVVYSTTQNPTTLEFKIANGSGTGAFSIKLTNLSEETTYYARAYAINSNGTAYGEEISFTTKDFEWVDLGLSVKWATCNVGASTPEEYGDYFAWGETEPKSTYNWSTYKYCNGSDSTLTKYNNSSSYGTVDNKTVLDKTDDAAAVNWGGSWRIPTEAEQDELRDNCSWIWTTQSGVNGYKVTSKKNGNSIFLPAAGTRNDSSFLLAGSSGYYWSSSLYTEYPNDAWNVYFGSGGVYRSFRRRYCGLSVRPVCQ